MTPSVEVRRQRLVERLDALGFSPASVAAIGRVPRERLVPQFWVDGVGHDTTTSVPASALDALFDPDRALAVKPPGPRGEVTSTASALRVLAAQLDLLELEPGDSVLEIGTGPGYFAAVLAEMVGPQGSVTTVDIDAEVAGPAAQRLRAEGYDQIEVVVGDGHRGVPDRAPFDRVVASVGCADVSAAWLAQLVADGRALVPLLLGGVHPMVMVDRAGEGAMVSRSGYVAIQGAQSDCHLWPASRRVIGPGRGAALPAALAAAVRPAAGRAPVWDLGVWIALHDQGAVPLAGLERPDGAARIDGESGAVLRTTGSGGVAAADELVDLATRWVRAGCPRMEDYRLRFVPSDRPAPPPVPGLRWVLTRLDHHQVVERPAA
ncbi:MAG: protein-L-isoaspartate O-methyltransferase family protein [Acidimicrobiales bacterium]